MRAVLRRWLANANATVTATSASATSASASASVTERQRAAQLSTESAVEVLKPAADGTPAVHAATHNPERSNTDDQKDKGHRPRGWFQSRSRSPEL